MYKEIKEFLESRRGYIPNPARKEELDLLANYIYSAILNRGNAKLSFICTHNSRRSQLAQVWGQAIARFVNLPVTCYSAGMEETRFHPNAIASLTHFGFRTEEAGDGKFSIYFSDWVDPALCYSKLIDDPANPSDRFAAIMTCSDADENCPYVPGAETRIRLPYSDPGASDGTANEAEVYRQRSGEIASDLLYAFRMAGILMERSRPE